MNNLKQLQHLMIDYSLDRQAVADLLGKSKLTIDAWFAPENSRSMPDNELKLLTYLLQPGSSDGRTKDYNP